LVSVRAELRLGDTNGEYELWRVSTDSSDNGDSVDELRRRTAYGCGRSGVELHNDELGTGSDLPNGDGGKGVASQELSERSSGAATASR
jgi:hypothetical protein